LLEVAVHNCVGQAILITVFLEEVKIHTIHLVLLVEVLEAMPHLSLASVSLLLLELILEEVLEHLLLVMELSDSSQHHKEAVIGEFYQQTQLILCLKMLFKVLLGHFVTVSTMLSFISKPYGLTLFIVLICKYHQLNLERMLISKP
jgi:hypothetical protein